MLATVVHWPWLTQSLGFEALTAAQQAVALAAGLSSLLTVAGLRWLIWKLRGGDAPANALPVSSGQPQQHLRRATAEARPAHRRTSPRSRPNRRSAQPTGPRLTMSNSRNRANAMAYQIRVFGSSNNAIHMPMNSSQTMKPGSVMPVCRIIHALVNTRARNPTG